MLIQSIQRNTAVVFATNAAALGNPIYCGRLLSMLPSATIVTTRSDLYHGLFLWVRPSEGQPQLTRHAAAPASIPDPQSGRLLKVSTLDASARAICPSCRTTAQGGFVSFVQDLRLAYACPSCQQLVWLPGA